MWLPSSRPLAADLDSVVFVVIAVSVFLLLLAGLAAWGLISSARQRDPSRLEDDDSRKPSGQA